MQACVVTGVPLRETVDFLIEERYVRTASNLEEVEVCLDEAEPLENGAINIGEMLAQSLAIAVNLFCRVPLKHRYLILVERNCQIIHLLGLPD